MALQTANQYGLGIDGVGLSNRLLKIMQANKVDAATAQTAKAEALQQQLKTTGAQLLHIRNNIEGKEAQKKAIANLATEKINQGQDSGIYDELLNIDDPDLLNTRMTQIIIRATDADKQLEKGLGINGDVKHQFGGQVLYKDTKTGKKYYGQSVKNPNTAEIRASLVAADGSGSQPEGKLELMNTLGQTRMDKISDTVETTRQTEDIKTAQELTRERNKLREELKTKPTIAKETRLATLDAELAKEAFKQANIAQNDIRDLREVVRLVEEEGAETGPIADMFPSFRSATVKLENMQKQLGLNVIGAVTFGALSKGELDLALSKALPTGLDGPELVQWANEKIAAQQKLADYFSEQALFLSEGGTQPEWIRKQRANQKALQSGGLTPEEQAEFDQLQREKDAGLF